MSVRHEPIDRETLRACGQAIVGALTVGGTQPLNDVQAEMLTALSGTVFGIDVDARSIVPIGPDDAAAAIANERLRLRVVQFMVALELVLHPLPVEVERSVEQYALALDVHEPMVHAAREYAAGHVALLYADIQRNSLYTEVAVRESRRGRLWELLRSKIAYIGIVPDAKIEAKWAALADLPGGTWGRELIEFYREHNFPLPGSRRGISEIGAMHDWIHVLASYPPNPEGEIDVFTFIAASTDDPKAFTLVVTTLALFQDLSIKHASGKRIAIARADTLSDPDAPKHFAEAVVRGLACNVDVMAIDHFAYADRLLEDVRSEFGVPPLVD